MTAAHATESETDDSSSSTLDRLQWGLIEGALFAAALVWTGFWLNIARLHWTLNGNQLNVLFVGATLVAPAVVIYGDHALSITDVTDYEHELVSEVPTPGSS